MHSSRYQEFSSQSSSRKEPMISMETTVDADTAERRQHKAGKSVYMAVGVGLILVLVAGIAVSLHLNKEAVPQQSAVELKGDIAFGNIVNNRNTYPFVVDLSIRKSDGTYVCTGNIVSQDWVLTAAHCLWDRRTNAMVANGAVTSVAGSIVRNPRTPGAQSRTSSQLQLHANHDLRDVGLFRVSNPYDLTDAAVGIIEISANRPAVGTQLTAAGWGTREDASHTNNLRAATMNVRANADCGTNRDYEICTNGGSGNTCGGDSGGPLLRTQNGQTKVVGLNSYSWTDCSDLNANNDIFQSTPSYINWVYGIVAVRFGQVYYLKNGYASWSGGWLDTRARGCESNVLCVSTATSKNRDSGSGQWRIESATPGRNGAVKNGDIVYLVNQYPNGGYLDTRARGCEGNNLCVSTASTGNRDNGSGKWRIDADPAVEYIVPGVPIHLVNQYPSGGYLDTRARGCEGNDLCVSTSSTRLRDSGSTFWKFYEE